MLTPRRRLAVLRDTGHDAGISLTELLVTMVLMTIVCGLALTWLIGENTTDTKTQNSSFALGSARTVLSAWPALLQVADSPWNGPASATPSGSQAPTPLASNAAGTSSGRVLAMSATSISFNADVGAAPSSTCADSCVRSGNTTATTLVTLALTKGALTQTLAQTGSAAKSITLVASGAALTSPSGCLFAAYAANGNPLGCGSSTPLASIASITLAFTVTPTQNGAPQTFQTSVALTGSMAPIVSPAPAASG